MRKKRELAIVALSSSESQPGNYVLILEDLDQLRRIPIIIGMPEAQSIAIAMEQMLEKVIEKEDYESASKIRDYIVKRKGGAG